MNSSSKHYRTCNLCEAMCGIEITTEGQEIVSIKGDANDPFSRGHICPKAIALKDLHEDPDRLKQPMEKTADGWKTIGWEEAFDKIAIRINRIRDQHGNDAVAIYQGNPNVHNTGNLLFSHFFVKALRTRNKFSATSVDQLPHHIVAYKLFGHQLKIPVPDIDHCTHFLILGGNPLASNGSIMSVPDVKKRLKTIQANGGKVVVVDPRKTETADIASEHHFIRPGTDALLMLAMINTLFKKGLANPGRAAAFVPGWERIEGYTKEFTARKAAPVTGISAANIERLVEEFTQAEAAVCYGRLGVSVQEFGTLTQYLIMLFNILCGRLDAVGGMMFTKAAVDILSQTGAGHIAHSRSRVRQLPEFNGEYPVATLAEEILTEGPGQIRALFSSAGNPVLSTPNGHQLSKALEKLDYMVAIDFYLNETSKHADIILPPVGPLEREHYDVIFHVLAIRNTAKYAPALFTPPGNSKHDWEIFLSLQERLQHNRTLKDQITTAMLRRLGPTGLLNLFIQFGPYGGGLRAWQGLTLKQLKENPHGVDLGALKPRLPEHLSNRDKLVDLAFDYFMSDLPRLKKTLLTKTKPPADQFLLIGRRHVRSNNSWLHNSYRLVKGKNRCTAMLHPTSAKKLKLGADETIEIKSKSGQIQIPVEITEAVMPGVVCIPHGWGHNREGIKLSVAQEHAGVSINDITDEQAVDELSGNAVLNGVPVVINKIKAQKSSSKKTQRTAKKKTSKKVAQPKTVKSNSGSSKETIS